MDMVMVIVHVPCACVLQEEGLVEHQKHVQKLCELDTCAQVLDISGSPSSMAPVCS